jgi:hypothetical protein
MTHAEKVREAERAVIAAAIAQAHKEHSVTYILQKPLGSDTDYVVFTVQTNDRLRELESLRAATCPTCYGTGTVETAVWPVGGLAACPAGCDNGRKRT